MKLKWTDSLDIASDLENFDDIPENSNEKILEAIQMNWIEEL